MLGWTAGPAVTDTARRPSSPLVSWRVWQKRRAQAASIFCFWSTGRCTLVSVGGFLHVDDTFDFVTMKKRAVYACVEVVGLGGSVGRGNRCRDLCIHRRYCIILEMREAPASVLLQTIAVQLSASRSLLPCSLSLAPPLLPGDYAVVRFRPKGRSTIKVPGRLKVSSRSLVFDPVNDVSQVRRAFLLLPFPSSPHSYCKHCHCLPLPPPFLPPRPLVSA